VPLIVGMGKAAELTRKHLPDYKEKVRPLRDMLEEGILSSVPDKSARFIGSGASGTRRLRPACHTERSEESRSGLFSPGLRSARSRRDSSLRCAPFGMTLLWFT
jgi:hypothetical protein